MGLGITALIAGFMSGMAGNVSAFTTVWTYDNLSRANQERCQRCALCQHGPLVHPWLGVAISIGTAYLVMDFKSIMDYVQALFQFLHRSLFGTVILGMLWKRATAAGGFWGLLSGTVSSIGLWAWVKIDPSALRYVALSDQAKDMAENMYRALWSWIVLRSRNRGRQLHDEAETRIGVERPGVWRHGNSFRRPLVSGAAPSILGSCRGGIVRCR